ncbi:MAG: hypothetical protein Kow0013_07360 [Pararhodobacter sp.]
MIRRVIAGGRITCRRKDGEFGASAIRIPAIRVRGRALPTKGGLLAAPWEKGQPLANIATETARRHTAPRRKRPPKEAAIFALRSRRDQP